MSSTTPASASASATTAEEVEVEGEANNNHKNEKVSREELMELVGAIKFAHSDFSQRQVHHEISHVLSQKPEFAFLANVALNDVKKVWKKALQQQQQPSPTESKTTTAPDTTKSTTTTTSSSSSSSVSNADLVEKLCETQNQATPATVIPQLFTVGDGSVPQLAKAYTAASLAAATSNDSNDDNKADDDYVHVFLNVPADRSGSRPHQALINFQKQQQQQQLTTDTTTSSTANNDDDGNKDDKEQGKDSSQNNRVIVKIQMAAPMSAEDTTRHPMLVYDQTKTLKTFLHPGDDDDNNKDNDDYERIRNWITLKGVGGALGTMGGTKAYFYAIPPLPPPPPTTTTTTKNKKKSKPLQLQEPILSILVTELAPPQSW